MDDDDDDDDDDDEAATDDDVAAADDDDDDDEAAADDNVAAAAAAVPSPSSIYVAIANHSLTIHVISKELLQGCVMTSNIERECQDRSYRGYVVCT